MNRTIPRWATTATLATGLAFAPFALAQAPMPQPQMQGSVTYLNGGAGDEEVQYIKQAMKDYSLVLAFARAASPRAEYVASVAVTVKDSKGNTVFEAPSVGPYLLLKLPAGGYSVTATYQSQAQTRPVTAGKSANALVTFEWK
jgi:hypothetical protein